MFNGKTTKTTKVLVGLLVAITAWVVQQAYAHSQLKGHPVMVERVSHIQPALRSIEAKVDSILLILADNPKSP